MGRIIKLESAGKERTQLLRSISLAVLALMGQDEVNTQVRDLAAFITLALEAISETIEISVSAWEKRGYWLKADKFRLEWCWAENLGKKMRIALFEEDWSEVALTTAHVAEKIKDIYLPKHTRSATPWVGAWKTFQETNKR